MKGPVVVCGALGQLGAELVRELQHRGYVTFPFDKKQLDISDYEHVERKLGSIKPELVINAAAYNQVDLAESNPLAAFLVNALAVRNLALVCRQLGARLVHFSTDYVFDGAKQSPYTEEDWPHPLNAYAVSKLAGEYYARAYLDTVLIIRTSGVFGPRGLFTARGNFVELMLRLAAEGRQVRVVQDHVASPTYAPLLAARTIDLVERGIEGLFHIGGGTPISWYDYARMIFEVAGVEANLVPTNEREYRTAARRPKYSALSNAKLESLGFPPMPPLRKALELYFAERSKILDERKQTKAG